MQKIAICSVLLVGLFLPSCSNYQQYAEQRVAQAEKNKRYLQSKDYKLKAALGKASYSRRHAPYLRGRYMREAEALLKSGANARTNASMVPGSKEGRESLVNHYAKAGDQKIVDLLVSHGAKRPEHVVTPEKVIGGMLLVKTLKGIHKGMQEGTAYARKEERAGKVWKSKCKHCSAVVKHKPTQIPSDVLPHERCVQRDALFFGKKFRYHEWDILTY